jgi:hypothetical protein
LRKSNIKIEKKELKVYKYIHKQKGGLLNMIKKQQKWIALLVTLTFMWLLQVSTMPLAAANTPEQISQANKEQGPSFVEEEGDSAYQVKKKSILPYILIGVGVVALAAVLFLVVLKTKYDITGEWRYSWKNTGDANWKYTNQKIVFTGDKKQGTLNYMDAYMGTYTVDGKNVTVLFTIESDWHVTNTGTFDGKDKITGTFQRNEIASLNGSWELVRVSTTTHIGMPLNQQGIPGKASDK